ASFHGEQVAAGGRGGGSGGFDVEILDQLFGDALEAGRGHDAAVADAAGGGAAVVNDHGDDGAGAAGREEADEGTDVVPVGVAAVDDFLRGAGLARDLEIGDARDPAGAVGDDAFEQARHGAGGLGGDDGAADGFAKLVNGLAGVVADLADDLRTHEHAVVGDGGHGVVDLQRGGRDGVAGGDAGDVGAAPLGHGVEQAGALVAEGETGFFAEAEGAGVVVELALAGEHGELGRAVVAGFADDLGDAHGRGGGMVVAHE